MRRRSERFDLKILDPRMKYKRLPFGIISDWIIGGQVLENDLIRPSGTKDWQPIRQHVQFADFFTPADAKDSDTFNVALEPVELGLSRPASSGEGDDEIDMIPLIDVSLVLLVFFVMTAGSMMNRSVVNTPEAAHAKVIEAKETVAVNMTMQDGVVQYFIGTGGQPVSEDELLRQFVDIIAGRTGSPVEVLLRASADIPFEIVQGLTIRLQQLGVNRILPSVREKGIGNGE